MELLGSYAPSARRSLTADVTERLRRQILDERSAPGAYLPAERVLSQRFRVSRVTVRRSLRRLVGEGLLQPVPCKGYRVCPPPAARVPLSCVAYLLADVEPNTPGDRTHSQLLAAFHRLLMERGASVLAVGAKGRTAAQVFDELQQAGVLGVLLDSSQPAFHAQALASGIPSVVVNASSDRAGLDVVIQDNLDGARRGVEYLLARGRRRIVWVGPTRGYPHFRERFAGARAGLWDAGRDFAPEDRLETASHEAMAEAQERVARRLKTGDRPDGFICPWLDLALGTARAIRESGLKLGKALDLVGWATEFEYRELLAPEFLGTLLPAMLLWRPAEMSSLALTRLEARAERPGEPAARTFVRIRLQEPQTAEEALRGRLSFQA